jgi:uroporphyrinogen decarboxylase
MTPKQRVQRAIRREPIDHVPFQTNYTGAMGRKLAAHLGVAESELPCRLSNHLRRVDIAYEKRTNDEGSVGFDWWGAGWSTQTEGYWHSCAPLAESLDLDSYNWPDAGRRDLLRDAATTIDAEKSYFIVPNLGMCLFERAWSLRGFDTLLIDLADRPEWVEELLDRITVIQVQLARRFVDAGVDAGYFGDDYGGQRSMLFSPRMWRRFIKPRLARMFAVFVDSGLPVILHSDGDIRSIVPDLVEIGMTVLNPVQPEVLDHGWLQAEYGDKIAFYGGISTQSVMAYGDARAAREATLACARTLAPGGTGLILGPSHRMQSDIAPENVEAMLEAFHELERGA